MSIATAERHLCADGFVPILFDKDGEQVMNVGRDERLFTPRQRIGLAARDGGCRFPDCDRPPSWTEAHHIDPWHEKHGRTDIADGVLLCRHHHMLVHNNGWAVTRTGNNYFVVPPRSLDPEQHPNSRTGKGARECPRRMNLEGPLREPQGPNRQPRLRNVRTARRGPRHRVSR